MSAPWAKPGEVEGMFLPAERRPGGGEGEGVCGARSSCASCRCGRRRGCWRCAATARCGPRRWRRRRACRWAASTGAMAASTALPSRCASSPRARCATGHAWASSWACGRRREASARPSSPSSRSWPGARSRSRSSSASPSCTGIRTACSPRPPADRRGRWCARCWSGASARGRWRPEASGWARGLSGARWRSWCGRWLGEMRRRATRTSMPRPGPCGERWRRKGTRAPGALARLLVTRGPRAIRAPKAQVRRLIRGPWATRGPQSLARLLRLRGPRATGVVEVRAHRLTRGPWGTQATEAQVRRLTRGPRTASARVSLGDALPSEASCRLPGQSPRRAIEGGTREARRAGSRAARKATAPSTATTTP